MSKATIPPCPLHIAAPGPFGLAGVADAGQHVTTIVTGTVMHEIQLRNAKATLSAVIDHAQRGEPSIITRHGKREAVVLSYEEWERLSCVPSFGRLLMAAPLEAEDLPARSAGPLREPDL